MIIDLNARLYGWYCITLYSCVFTMPTRNMDVCVCVGVLRSIAYWQRFLKTTEINDQDEVRTNQSNKQGTNSKKYEQKLCVWLCLCMCMCMCICMYICMCMCMCMCIWRCVFEDSKLSFYIPVAVFLKNNSLVESRHQESTTAKNQLFIYSHVYVYVHALGGIASWKRFVKNNRYKQPRSTSEPKTNPTSKEQIQSSMNKKVRSSRNRD